MSAFFQIDSGDTPDKDYMMVNGQVWKDEVFESFPGYT